MVVTWVVVANGSDARFFANEGCGKGLRLREHLSHPDSRKRELDLVTDAPGRTVQSAGVGTRPSIAWETSPKEVEMQRFAREIADHLDEGRKQGAFDRLVLVAPPQFLGLLRDTLESHNTVPVDGSLNKDYTQADVPSLIARLGKIMCP